MNSPVRKESAPAFETRMRRFNETTGVYGYVATGQRLLGGNHHPDRCRCQGDPFLGDGSGSREALGHGSHSPTGDTTPHKHYSKPPFKCARCSDCDGYVPHDEAKKDDLRREARQIVAMVSAGGNG